MRDSQNPIRATLTELGLISVGEIEELHSRVRDRHDVRVLRCRRTGVIFLSDPAVITESHYSASADFQYWGADDRERAVAATTADDSRRRTQFMELIAGRRWLDVGTGAGGALDQFRGVAAAMEAVEPQRAAREALQDLGYTVYQSVEEAPSDSFDVVTAFHVVEHLTTPVETLQGMRRCLKSSGQLVVEVPHARDFLITYLDVPAFKDFTFWSEHLILHTRESLRGLLAAAGFREIEVRGFQRYPLENHLHWLARGKPGGHELWADLGTPELARAYADMLEARDMTDTLIAMARS